MSGFMDLARRRYSLRRFDGRPVADEDLRLILEAGRLAPTGMNAQPQRILVVSGAEAMARLAEATPYTFQAPMALIVCYDIREAWVSAEGRSVAEIDATLVCDHMIMEATELGIGSLIVCGYDEATLRRAFDIPDAYGVAMCILLGHPTATAHPTWRLHDVRKPLDQTVFFGSFTRAVHTSDNRSDGMNVTAKDDGKVS